MAWTSESVPSTGSNWAAEVVPSFIGWTPESTQASSWKHTGHFGWAITSTESGSITYNIAFTITITFDEPVIDFDLTDFSTINCVISNLAGSGKVYTATCTKSYFGQITVAILNNRVTDDKGNKNSIGTLFSIDVQPSIFKSSWTLSGVERTITLPLVSGGTYSFDIDWGDGNTDTVTSWNQRFAGESVDMTHTYAGNGVKNIEIGGASNYTITGWKFDNTGDKLKIRAISDWGPLNISTDDVFYGCTNLNVTATNVPTISSSSLAYAFSGCTALTSIGGDWDTSSVTMMYETFLGCTNFNQDISGWNTAAVTNMGRMFQGASTFNQDINTSGSSWNVSLVQNMNGMFGNATNFDGDISSWIPSEVLHMDGMFLNATNFNQDIGSWNVAKVVNFYQTFRYATSFNQDLGSWNTASAVSSAFSQMFFGAEDFVGDGISSWDIDDITNMSHMFYLANALTTANYDAILIAWNARAGHQNNVNFNAGDAVLTLEGAAETARDELVGDGWTIYDSTGEHT
jgi:surface protein